MAYTHTRPNPELITQPRFCLVSLSQGTNYSLQDKTWTAFSTLDVGVHIYQEECVWQQNILT